MNLGFKKGLKDGLPIALGYLAVSFSVGVIAISGGLSVFQGGILSLSNMTSAGQLAGLRIIAETGTLIELIISQFIINLRYSLMSISLSQKLSEKVKLWQRFVIAFSNTDEIYAVAVSNENKLTFKYMLGLELLPIVGWTFGTIFGGICGNIMPDSLRIATGVALYGMFIAIVVPVAKKVKSVLYVVLISILISCILYYVPVFSKVSDGVSIIIATVVAAALGAVFFPIKQVEREKD